MFFWYGSRKKVEMSNKQTTYNYIKELTFEYKEEQVDKLLAYLDMVLDRNQHINLTAVKDRDEAIQKHIADSLTICKLDEYQNAKTVMDVGTGAGFPGALLAIADSDKIFTLMDSTSKRLKVIDEFAEKLEISNLSTLHARAEEVARKSEYAGQFDVCVSRAVANLATLSGWCLPFVKKGGYFISYKGENYQEELDAAEKSLKKTGGRLKRVVTIEGGAEEISGHVLLVIEKIK